MLGMKITKSMWPEIVLPHYALVADESRLGWLSFVWIYETSKVPKDYNIYLAGLKVRYRTRAIITRGLYIFYPLFEGQKRLFNVRLS